MRNPNPKAKNIFERKKTMKTQKRVLALVLTLTLAFVMTLSLAVNAFADETQETPKTYKITINGAVESHKYVAYQIFSGTLSEDGETLSNIDWGTGVNSSDFLADLATITVEKAVEEGEPEQTESVAIFAECETAEDVANVLAEYANDSAVAKAFAKLATQHKTSGTEAVDGTVTVTAPGYYLVVDETNLKGEDDTNSSSMLKVVGDATVNIKADKPKVEKKVKDKNDSTGKASGWQDSADHDIGDAVEFQLTGTLPNNFDDYWRYKYVFHDTLSAGLTYNGDAKVYVEHADGTREEITTYFEIEEEGGQLTVKCVNLKMEKLTPAIVSSDKIIVEYTATLNSNAVVGVPGNPNEVYLEYSNNPNYKGEKEDDEEDDEEPTGDTPKDKVIVFTYELDNTKVDQDGNPLDGAGFTLYKWVDYLPDDPDAEEPTYNDENMPELPAGWDKTPYTGLKPKSEHGTWIVVKELDITGKNGKFGFKGLDDGEYALIETTVPDGYNKAEDIYFTIKAEHDEEEDDPELTELEVTFKQGDDNEGTWAPGTYEEDDPEGTYEEGDLDGTFGGKIENNSGSNLPSTGGIGTTIFYIVGGLIVVLTGVLLITKTRMRGRD